MARKRAAAPARPQAESYEHPKSMVPMRPDVGTQAQFKKKKPPATYRYDSSLAPEMQWDGQNPAREQAEALIARIAELAGSLANRSPGDRSEATHRLASEPANVSEAAIAGIQAAAEELKALSRPFLNWSGKAERTSFDVPTLPLFVHERLSTKAIIETLAGHRLASEPANERQAVLFDLFGDPQHSIADQVLKAYEYQDNWTNRMILGDSLVVMNSLLHYENLGGQVQMIYIDPPYGVKFGSNFQPFVRKRDVKHGDDEDMSREPEMVQAYRDTWELGLHSYLTYMRDRLLVARELLTPSGSIFVQISDDNVHHVRELLDEVFGDTNFLALITLAKTASATVNYLPGVADYVLLYAKDIERVKYRQLYTDKSGNWEGVAKYDQVQLPGGERRALKADEKNNLSLLPTGAKLYTLDNLTSQSEGRQKGEGAACWFPVELDGNKYTPSIKGRWKTNESGMDALKANRRIAVQGNNLRYVRFLDDFPVMAIGNVWSDIGGGVQSRSDPKIYVVQTGAGPIQRCLLMTTDPGDLVLDPTCGSGTTAYVAEQWGRRWITADVSRVPLALARQRLLTATFPWYELKDEAAGPAGGFVYKRKQNKKGEEVGGIVPHVTLKSIANNEPPKEEVLVDRPETASGITRVTGKFCVEGTIPAPMDWDDGEGHRLASEPANMSQPARAAGSAGNVPLAGSLANRSPAADYEERMIEILRKSPVLRLEGNRNVALRNIRPPAKSLSLSAEAFVDASAIGSQASRLTDANPQLVAFVFGPENGAVTEKLVFAAAREAAAKSYSHLYVIGFAIQPNARSLIENCEAVTGIAATYVQATPDLLMGDLLKNMRSSQIFSVCGLPEVKVRKAKGGEYQVELLGLDVFDPITMDVASRKGDDVPCWLLDTDYNDLCFHVSQAFFPRTAAWDNLKKALKGEYDESVWEHLAGATSAPFEPGEHRKIAVKVIDDRGNELMVVKELC